MLLQGVGDHIVWRDGDHVKKSPHKSRLSIEQVKGSILFFDTYLREFSPRTDVINILDSYCIIQPYIAGDSLGTYLQKNGTSLNPKVKQSMVNFATRVLNVHTKTGIVFDLIGSPYGMKGCLRNSSNILINDTETNIWIPDNILSRSMIEDSAFERKIKNTLLPGRYRRKEKFKALLREMMQLGN